MPRIDQELDIWDTVIQQVLSTSVTPSLTMTEDDMEGSILKSDGQKEDDAAPLISLWYSWFYRSWKANRAMVQSLTENWQ